jgi:hypothetical protein
MHCSPCMPLRLRLAYAAYARERRVEKDQEGKAGREPTTNKDITA